MSFSFLLFWNKWQANSLMLHPRTSVRHFGPTIAQNRVFFTVPNKQKLKSHSSDKKYIRDHKSLGLYTDYDEHSYLDSLPC